MKLFIIYIGGSHERSFIELHDMRFIVASKIEDTYHELRQSWWGKPESLHLDAWGSLEGIDGYEIELKNYPSNNDQQLYFVNLGGYDSKQFTELHQNVFVAARDKMEAKTKAKMQIGHWESPHQDYQYQVDDLVNVNEALVNSSYHIHLSPSTQSKRFEFICQYTPIG